MRGITTVDAVERAGGFPAISFLTCFQRIQLGMHFMTEDRLRHETTLHSKRNAAAFLGWLRELAQRSA